MFITSFSSNSGGYNSILSLLSFVVIFILILVLAYYATRFIAKYQNNLLNAKSNIKILESYRLGNNKFIAIVKIGEDFYAIALGKDEVTLIDKLNKDTLKIPDGFIELSNDNTTEQVEHKNIDFKDIFSRAKNKK